MRRALSAIVLASVLVLSTAATSAAQWPYPDYGWWVPAGSTSATYAPNGCEGGACYAWPTGYSTPSYSTVPQYTVPYSVSELLRAYWSTCTGRVRLWENSYGRYAPSGDGC
jgi:hypothetical protein